MPTLTSRSNITNQAQAQPREISSSWSQLVRGCGNDETELKTWKTSEGDDDMDDDDGDESGLVGKYTMNK